MFNQEKIAEILQQRNAEKRCRISHVHSFQLQVGNQNDFHFHNLVSEEKTKEFQ